jgi:hypothetical protein
VLGIGLSERDSAEKEDVRREGDQPEQKQRKKGAERTDWNRQERNAQDAGSKAEVSEDSRAGEPST